MKKSTYSKLFSRIFPNYIFIIICFCIITWFTAVSFKSFYIKRISNELDYIAHIVSHYVSVELLKKDYQNIPLLIKNVPKHTDIRLTIILKDGTVIADSMGDYKNMDNHLLRPEIQSILNGKEKSFIRFSKTLRKKMMYLAVPIERNHVLVAIARSAIPIKEIDNVLWAFYIWLVAGLILIVVVIVIISIYMARQITRPIEILRKGADQFAKGNLNTPLPKPKTEELSALAKSMKNMAKQLKVRIIALETERNEKEKLLTEVEKLSRMRQEFVANVSHELRTPITLIKGFVETLLSGAVHEKDNAQKFLTIVKNHSERLNNIIEDLLSLSKIEQDEANFAIELEDTFLEPLLVHCIEICQPKAEGKSIQLTLSCQKNFKANINFPLLEQALVNLLDNAIKYSPQDSEVELKLFSTHREIVISVSDKGSGIPKEHIPNLFQRFYRVDKARSRQVGGTGLGLAIVKHIVHAHKGHISVDSEVDKGSTFSIKLPV